MNQNDREYIPKMLKVPEKGRTKREGESWSGEQERGKCVGNDMMQQIFRHCGGKLAGLWLPGLWLHY